MNFGTTAIDITNLSRRELRQLRDAIDAELGELSRLNLEQELVQQFLDTREVLAETRDDPDIEPQKLASLQNSCTTLLAQLTKAQKALYSTERIKAMEQALFATLEDCPEVAEKFINDYQERLERLDDSI